MTSSSVKNLIFDLGGVILDLSVNDTLQSFAKLSGIPKERVEEIFHTSTGFLEYEKGLMSDSSFRDFIRDTYSVKATDNEIDSCWNAMLKGIPVRHLNLLERLKDRYNVLLLSNTNGIHLGHIDQNLLPSGNTHDSLDDYFHKAYYSHRMFKRKPDAEIFLQVLNENNLMAEETLFLDDNLQNVDGAASVGIVSVHVDAPGFILKYFDGERA